MSRLTVFMTTNEQTSAPTELDTILAVLAERRAFLTGTATDLSTDQSRLKPTVSELCIGGIIKHVSGTEKAWAKFMVGGVDAMGVDYDAFNDIDWSTIDQSDPSTIPAALAEFADEWVVRDDQTLEGILAEYAEVAAETERIARGLASLDEAHDLPKAPWFEPGGRWSARRTLLHLISETAHHSGHADIIREAIDGCKSMG